MLARGEELNMRAAIVAEFGPLDGIRVEEVETPEPAADEILVRTTVAGVNFADAGMVLGTARRREPPFTPGVEGAGIMVELGEETGVLFFAWFTFPESAQALAAAREEWLTAATGGSQGKTSVGSTDQRWLTAFGAIPPQGNFMSISYENTTGGAFDQTSPIPTTNSAYGTGTVELIGCSQMEVTYDLPGGVSGSAQMYRIIPDGELECYRSTPAGPVTP